VKPTIIAPKKRASEKRLMAILKKKQETLQTFYKYIPINVYLKEIPCLNKVTIPYHTNLVSKSKAQP